MEVESTAGSFPNNESWTLSWGQRLGWVCPLCGAVYSPDITKCPHCNGKEGTITVTYTPSDEWEIY